MTELLEIANVILIMKEKTVQKYSFAKLLKTSNLNVKEYHMKMDIQIFGVNKIAVIMEQNIQHVYYQVVFTKNAHVLTIPNLVQMTAALKEHATRLMDNAHVMKAFQVLTVA